MSIRDPAKPYIVTIDGLAGVGKSTVAREVARRLGLMHLNSGAIYRSIAKKALDGGVALENEAALLAIARKCIFSFVLDAGGRTRFLLDGADSMAALMEEKVSAGSSWVALHPMVRELANEVQRSAAKTQSAVVEGRDTGTIVFPGADFKFFLTASPRTRALRRYRQHQGSSGKPVNEQDLEKLITEIVERDRRDETRACAPTVKAEDAKLLDTSELTADEVVERILQIVNQQPRN